MKEINIPALAPSFQDILRDRSGQTVAEFGMLVHVCGQRRRNGELKDTFQNYSTVSDKTY